MSHQGITAGAHHDGIYHPSHALEGGSEVAGTGQLKEWWPDTFNRKILISTNADVQLWEMDGSGFNSTVFASPIGIQGNRIYANTSQDRFFWAQDASVTSSKTYIYGYDGLLKDTNSFTIVGGGTPTVITTTGYSRPRNDGYNNVQRVYSYNQPPVTRFGNPASVEHVVEKVTKLDDSNGKTEVGTIADTIKVTQGLNTWIFSGSANGGIPDTIGFTYYTVQTRTTWFNYVITSQTPIILDQDGTIIHTGAVPQGIYYSGHTLAVISGNLVKVPYGSAIGSGTVICSDIDYYGALWSGRLPGTLHTNQLFQNAAHDEWVVIRDSTTRIDLGIYPERSNCQNSINTFFDGDFLYYDEKNLSNGNDYISRINLNSLHVEHIVELAP